MGVRLVSFDDEPEGGLVHEIAPGPDLMNRNKEEKSTPRDVKPAEGSSADIASDGPQAAAARKVKSNLSS